MKTCDCYLWATDFDFKHCLKVRWRVKVVADRSGKWCPNGIEYNDYAKAEAAALDLFSRWTAVQDWRVVACD